MGVEVAWGVLWQVVLLVLQLFLVSLLVVLSARRMVSSALTEIATCTWLSSAIVLSSDTVRSAGAVAGCGVGMCGEAVVGVVVLVVAVVLAGAVSLSLRDVLETEELLFLR